MVSNQAYLFLVFTVNGIVIGLLFDFFRISRKVFNTNDIMTYVEDILFWILAGITILYSIFIFNNGEMRLFMFLAILLGAFAYMVLISSYIIKINIKIINTIKRILEILSLPLKAIFKPIHFLFINVRKNFTNFGTKICKKGKIVKN